MNTGGLRKIDATSGGRNELFDQLDQCADLLRVLKKELLLLLDGARRSLKTGAD